METKNNNIVTTATGAIKILWKDGVFKSWSNQDKIVKYLADKEYHFSSPELGMALKRAKFLTRNGKRGSYEYIQKYPFINDEK